MRGTLSMLAAVVLAATPLTAQTTDTTGGVVQAFTAAEREHYMALGKRLTAYFFGGEADSIAAMLTDQMSREFGGPDGIRTLMDQVAEQAGMVLEVLAEEVHRRDGQAEYWWEANFSEYTREPVVFRWVFNEAGQVSGFDADPKSNMPPPGREG